MRHRRESGSSMMAVVWAVTILAVSFIIGIAIMMSRGDRTPPPAPQQTAQPAPRQTVQSQTQAQATAQPATKQASIPPATGSGAPAAPAVRPNPMPPPAPRAAGPELQIGKLAGSLRVGLAGLPKTGERLPLDHTCYRRNQSPSLIWVGAPRGAESLVVVMERRKNASAPEWTWMLFNVDPGAGKLPASLPRVAQLPGGARHAMNINGNAYYSGPCEPSGKINYALRLFALDKKLDVPAGASRDDLVRAMNGHIIDATEFPFVHYLNF